MSKKDRPTVRVKPSKYQPTRKELKKRVTVRTAGGKLPTPKELARVALRQVNVVEDPDA